MQLKNNAELQGGKYRIIRTLGQGGYGITYLAVHTLLDKNVAIKEFYPREFCDRDGVTSQVTLGTTSNREFIGKLRAKFVKEARNLARLNHPGIVKIHDVFEENNTAYYVMEWIDGPSLAEVSEKGKLNVADAVNYVTQVGKALDYVHGHKITHLDVKPANIMIRRDDNQAVLIDFGLSKQYNSTGGQTSTTPVGISHGYAPIEQYSSDGMTQFSPQTDVYALGATFYKLITGIKPPQAIELLESPLRFPDGIETRYVDAIKAAMAPVKTARTQSAGEFVAALSAVHGESAEKRVDEPIDDYNDSVTVIVESVPDHKSDSKAEYFNGKPKSKKQNTGVTMGIVALLAAALGVGSYLMVRGGGSTDGFEADSSVIVDSDTAAVVGQSVVADVPRPDAPVVAKAEETKSQPAATLTPKPTAPKPQTTPSMPAAATPVKTNTSSTVATYTPAVNAGHSAAELYKLGLAAFESEKYTEAVTYYKQAAGQGNAQAQYALAECMYHGWGTAKNRSSAASWYKAAAMQGLAKAQYQLGDCYRYGDGVTANQDEARRWYRKAADQGHRSAERALEELN